MLSDVQKRLLAEIADLHKVPEGAYNIRANGTSAGRSSTANIEITSKEDKPGIDIRIKPGTKNESVHIPVVVSESGLKDVVYNDFFVGDDSDVLIVAGCGINNCGSQDSDHDGVHRFFVGRNARVKYVEKHYGEGEGTGKRIEKDAVTKLIQETKGQYLADAYGRAIEAVTTSSSGGRTESALNLRGTAVSYLQSVEDYDSDSPEYTWERRVSPALLEGLLAHRG